MPGAQRDIIVIGGSAGALEALKAIVASFPSDMAAAVFVVVHTSPDAVGALDRILTRFGKLPASYATDGESIEPGRIRIAPADRHLVLRRRTARLTRGPRENHFRPAIDPLFRTAAVAHGPRAIGVILSGGQNDGAVGLGMVKHRGGIAIAQDPREATVAAMPQAAISHVEVDDVLTAREIGARLVTLIGAPAPISEDIMPLNNVGPDVAEQGGHAIHSRPDSASPFTCPDCGGALWQSADGELLQFSCHVGHRYSGESLAVAQDEALDRALWAGLRALEERSELRRRMATHAATRGMSLIAARYAEDAAESEKSAGDIRRVLMPERRPADAEAAESIASGDR